MHKKRRKSLLRMVSARWTNCECYRIAIFVLFGLAYTTGLEINATNIFNSTNSSAATIELYIAPKSTANATTNPTTTAKTGIVARHSYETLTNADLTATTGVGWGGFYGYPSRFAGYPIVGVFPTLKPGYGSLAFENYGLGYYAPHYTGYLNQGYGSTAGYRPIGGYGGGHGGGDYGYGSNDVYGRSQLHGTSGMSASTGRHLQARLNLPMTGFNQRQSLHMAPAPAIDSSWMNFAPQRQRPARPFMQQQFPQTTRNIISPHRPYQNILSQASPYISPYQNSVWPSSLSAPSFMSRRNDVGFNYYPTRHKKYETPSFARMPQFVSPEALPEYEKPFVFITTTTTTTEAPVETTSTLEARRRDFLFEREQQARRAAVNAATQRYWQRQGAVTALRVNQKAAFSFGITPPPPVPTAGSNPGQQRASNNNVLLGRTGSNNLWANSGFIPSEIGSRYGDGSSYNSDAPDKISNYMN